jgi:hypothetical protein
MLSSLLSPLSPLLTRQPPISTMGGHRTTTRFGQRPEDKFQPRSPLAIETSGVIGARKELIDRSESVDILI